jgi:hypothetical protein
VQRRTRVPREFLLENLGVTLSSVAGLFKFHVGQK